MIRRAGWALVLTALLASGCLAPADLAPTCGRSGLNVLVLMAQAVPEADYVPCVATFPEEWSVGGMEIDRGHAEFRVLVNLQASGRIDITLRPECDVADAVAHPSPEAGPQRFDLREQVRGRTVRSRLYRFPGECIVQRFDLAPAQRGPALRQAASALGFAPRERVNAWYEQEYGWPLELP